MRMINSVVIRENPPSKRPRKQCRLNHADEVISKCSSGMTSMDFRQLKGTKYSGNIALFRHMLKHLYAQRTHHEFRKSGPDSSSGRASASGAGGRRFETRPRHTKGVKNGTSGYLAWSSAL